MGSQALELFYRMPRKSIVNQTYVCILNACSHSGLVEEARKIFSSIQTRDKRIVTTMVNITRVIIQQDSLMLCFRSTVWAVPPIWAKHKSWSNSLNRIMLLVFLCTVRTFRKTTGASKGLWTDSIKSDNRSSQRKYTLDSYWTLVSPNCDQENERPEDSICFACASCCSNTDR